MAAKRPRRGAYRLDLRLPAVAGERLRFVRVLDGRPAVEWARAVLLEALGRLLLERPGWAWARPGSPWWREGTAGGAPAGALAGGERVLVLALLPERFGADVDPEGDGLGFLADVVPADDGPAGRLLRRVEVRAVDVLPWRKRRGEGVPSGSPGDAAIRDRAREAAERRSRAGGARSSPVDGGPSPV